MLPLSITRHPYFHEDLNLEKANFFLFNEDNKANMLFINGKSNQEFILCYKASFRGNIEFRVLTLTYNTDQKSIKSTSLGNSSTLHGIYRQLPKFLTGFVGGEFNPQPAYKEKRSELTQLFLKQTVSFFSLNFLCKDIFINHIFSKIDRGSLFNAIQVSKEWYLYLNSHMPALLKRHDQMEKETVEFIFEFIERKLKPISKSSIQLEHEEFVLSGVQRATWDESIIRCKMDTKDLKTKYLLISRHSIQLVDNPYFVSATSVNHELYIKLLNACIVV